jgi:hypothetical protein
MKTSMKAAKCGLGNQWQYESSIGEEKRINVKMAVSANSAMAVAA